MRHQKTCENWPSLHWRYPFFLVPSRCGTHQGCILLPFPNHGHFNESALKRPPLRMMLIEKQNAAGGIRPPARAVWLTLIVTGPPPVWLKNAPRAVGERQGRRIFFGNWTSGITHPGTAQLIRKSLMVCCLLPFISGKAKIVSKTCFPIPGGRAQPSSNTFLR